MKLILLLLPLLFFSPWCAAQDRFALVIGNGDYKSVAKLKNPANDAGDMTQALTGLGFQVKTVVNGTLDQMEDGVVWLGQALQDKKKGVGVFFYAGHGVQTGGVNYLIPTDADIKTEAFLKSRALAVQLLLDTFQESGNFLNVVILDACRDNPFGWSRSASRGLSVVGSQPAGSLIAYATSAGSVAQDGEGRNGLFTQMLLKNLVTPGLEIKDVFNRTGADVMAGSHNQQVPAVYNQFFQSAYLKPGAPVASQESWGEALVAPGGVRVATKTNGTFTFRGQSRPLPDGGTLSIDGVPPGNYVAAMTYFDGESETQRIQVASGSITPVALNHVPRPLPSGFVSIPGGTWKVGDGAEIGQSDELPVHEVTLNRFAISSHEVTEREWLRVSTSVPDPGASRGLDGPVTRVSWFNAVEYCNALSLVEGRKLAYHVSGISVEWDRTADGYRLPTEAEWECAACGPADGSLFRYAGTDNADFAGWYAKNSQAMQHPVETKTPNLFGLYDMSGNVQEWCWDRYGPYGPEAQKNPTGAASGDMRVIRGGGFEDPAGGMRVTNRSLDAPTVNAAAVGFRLVVSQQMVP
jgi:formylglycine-generating enzyme required for sulfatase activity